MYIKNNNVFKYNFEIYSNLYFRTIHMIGVNSQITIDVGTYNNLFDSDSFLDLSSYFDCMTVTFMFYL